MKQFPIIFLAILLLGLSCSKGPQYPDEPVIGFIGMTKQKMDQSDLNADSLTAKISFTDGDGDLGSNDSLSLFVKDTRDGVIASKYKIPFISEQGTANGISGEISFLLYTTCCYYPDGSLPCFPSTKFPRDTVVYEVFIKDRAGHESNKLSLPFIELDCTK